jgi:hypothetical protein
MFLVRTLVVCTLAVGLFLNGSTADAAKAKAKKKHPTRGVVTAMADGTVTVKVHVSKKKAAAGDPTEKKFTLSEGTKFVKVTGKKKDRVESEASKDDLKVGSKVLVVATGDTADKVTLEPGKTKKKKKTT